MSARLTSWEKTRKSGLTPYKFQGIVSKTFLTEDPDESSMTYGNGGSVLDSIIRNYLLNELPPENDIVEKDFGPSRLGLGITLQNLPGTSSNRVNNDDHNNNVDNVQYPGTSFGSAANGRNNDHEYIKALHKCFEKRGVFKELQTFLRHKLVSILQDEWPDLQNPVRSGDVPNTIVLRLVEDFLCCHKLYIVYKLSVLASELDVGQQNTRGTPTVKLTILYENAGDNAPFKKTCIFESG
ncbi:unnamed protein product [Orchesella dallaii]|uniref:Uncharacterized protein n=1 Tax=Orchesella dallaii TaxID=48710 RepID=A0ABP1QAY8_9HEXA